jgi:transposase
MTEQEQQRLVKRRLAIIQHAQKVTGNVAHTCRYFGISRHTYYYWLRRYEEKGLEGLRDKSRRPHHSPNATSAEVVGKIIYLRLNYHFGPGKISMYLKRYHEISVSPSGVWRVLQGLELNRLPASQKHKTYQTRWKRYEKPKPGHAVQVDVKFITPLGAAGKRFYQFTAIDDCTRLRVLKAYPRCNQKTAIQLLDYLLQKLPFRVALIQTDNGGEFGSQFHVHALDRESDSSKSNQRFAYRVHRKLSLHDTGRSGCWNFHVVRWSSFSSSAVLCCSSSVLRSNTEFKSVRSGPRQNIQPLLISTPLDRSMIPKMVTGPASFVALTNAWVAVVATVSGISSSLKVPATSSR